MLERAEAREPPPRNGAARPMNSLDGRWYFDVISPYAYLYATQRHRLHPRLHLAPVPILFAGLLGHWGHKGPAEIPSKRVHTYRHVAWLADRLGVPLRLPPRHPFNPLRALRLLTALGAPWPAVERALAFVWAEGRDPEQDWAALGTALGVDDPGAACESPAVKLRLREATDAALAAGVFGVPTVAVAGQIFWGLDTLDWLNDWLADPAMHERGELARAATIGIGTARRT